MATPFFVSPSLGALSIANVSFCVGRSKIYWLLVNSDFIFIAAFDVTARNELD
jgi:hypothetical protein